MLKSYTYFCLTGDFIILKNELRDFTMISNNCKAVNEYEQIGSLGSPTNNNQFVCSNILTSPANGDDDVFGDSALEPNVPIKLCHSTPFVLYHVFTLLT